MTDASRVMAVLDATADAVADALARTADWGETGDRPGEHHSDRAADAAALAVLHDAGLATLSEESGMQVPAGGATDPGVTVVVDPLDGSTNASRRMGWWATSLCAVDSDGPWVALVADQRHGTRWRAVRGEGATRDGSAITPTGYVELADAIVGLNGVPAGHGGWAQYRAFGAAALDLCAVADGTLDGYLDATTDELGVWDYLAATLVCAEAGVAVRDAGGRELCVLDHAARRTPVAGATGALGGALLRLHPRHGADWIDGRLP